MVYLPSSAHNTKKVFDHRTSLQRQSAPPMHRCPLVFHFLSSTQRMRMTPDNLMPLPHRSIPVAQGGPPTVCCPKPLQNFNDCGRRWSVHEKVYPSDRSLDPRFIQGLPISRGVATQAWYHLFLLKTWTLFLSTGTSGTTSIAWPAGATDGERRSNVYCVVQNRRQGHAD
jgi:hypothetical protein